MASSTEFASSKYNVTFTETGLPAEWPWSVVLNGGALVGSSNTSAIDFFLAPGTYTYSVRGFVQIPFVEPYMAHFANGRLQVVASSLTLPFRFSPTAELKIVVVGIPSNISWNVSLDNPTLGYWGNISGTGPTAPGTFLLLVFANSTYSYRYTLSGNYSRWDSSGSTVVGAGTATLSFPAGGLSVSGENPTLYAVAIAVGLVATGSILVVLLRKGFVGPPGGKVH